MLVEKPASHDFELGEAFGGVSGAPILPLQVPALGGGLLPYLLPEGFGIPQQAEHELLDPPLRYRGGMILVLLARVPTPVLAAHVVEVTLVVTKDRHFMVTGAAEAAPETPRSTHGGVRYRTDDEEALFDFQRPIVLNGITDVATRPDLLDRALLVELPVIPKSRRRSERELDAEIERERPELLGALLDAVSVGLRNIGAVELPERPRMADFAEWMVAAEEGLGWEAGHFMARYAGAISENQERALEGDPVSEAVLLFMAERREWSGTPTELHEALTRRMSDATARSKAWPTAPTPLRTS